MHRHHMSRLTALPLLATLTLACTDPSERAHPCGLSEDAARACQTSATDLSAAAQLGTIVDDGSGGWKFEPNGAVDLRYGAVFVTNTSSTDVRVKLTRMDQDSSGAPIDEQDPGEEWAQVNRDTPICAAEPCPRRWIDLLDDSRFVNVEVRPVAAPEACMNEVGVENCPCNTDPLQSACESGTHCSGDSVCVQNFVELGPVALFQADSDARTNIAANVVQLNCDGVRDFSGNDDREQGTDYVGNPRHFVSVLERDADGKGELIVANVSDAREPPTWCVYSGVAKFDRTKCQTGSMNDTENDDTEDADDWTWTLSGPVEPDLDNPLTLMLATDVDILAFVEQKSGKDCQSQPDGWDPDNERMRIRVLDTTANLVYFVELADCSVDDHVPAAAPFVVTPDANGEVKLINCLGNGDQIKLCDASYGSCDPVNNPEITVGNGESQTWTTTNECNHHDLSWDDSGDPTVIVRKKKVDTCGG